MYLHSIDPFLIQITPSFGIRWYSIAYILGFLFAWFFIRHLAKKDSLSLSTNAQKQLSQPMVTVKMVDDLMFYVIFGTIIGGRLGFCVFYEPYLFSSFSKYFPFWGVLEVHKGGMASHGGLVGIILAGILFAKKYNIAPLVILDLLSLVAPPGIFFGRIANFINGELVGRVCSEAYLWCVKFPQDILTWPIQESDKLLALGAIVQKFGINQEYWKDIISSSSQSSIVYAVLNKIISAVQNNSNDIILLISPLLQARHPSQLYEALLEGVLLFMILFVVWKNIYKTSYFYGNPLCGLVSANFLIWYSILRIIGEQFRMPDLNIGFQLLGFTRGQWLSFIPLIAGLVLYLFIYKTKTKGKK